MGGFQSLANAIAADYGFMRADLIFLCETHSKPARVREDFLTSKLAEEWTLFYVSGSEANASSNGQICLVRKQQRNNNNQFSLTLIGNNCSTSTGQIQFLYKNVNITELSLFKYIKDEETFFICSVYKHPNCTTEHFWRELKRFLGSYFHVNRPFNANFFSMFS